MKGGIYPTKTGWMVRFGKLSKRFKKHEKVIAERCLTGWRYKHDEGTFDERDYKASKPLGFANLVDKFLYTKRRLKGVKKYHQRIKFAVAEWGNRNAKEIGFGDIEDLLNSLADTGYSSKYIYDICGTIRMFFSWLHKRENIKIPEFPRIKPVMRFRKILTKEQQGRVLDEVYRLTWDLNPRIYIAVQFLATYINCRPKEILNIKEGNIELENQRILIEDPKERTPKYLFLLEEDVTLLKGLAPGFPRSFFFRHTKGNGAARPGQQFGKDYLYKWWRVASVNLNIHGVSLYPGTRHTSAVALRVTNSPESVKRAMGTKSNKAFERYLQVTGDELRSLYKDTRCNASVTHFKTISK